MFYRSVSIYYGIYSNKAYPRVWKALHPTRLGIKCFTMSIFRLNWLARPSTIRELIWSLHQIELIKQIS
jgi:hypothetical protein